MNKYEMIGWGIKIVWALLIYTIAAWLIYETVTLIIGGVQYYLEDVRTRE